MDTYERLSPYNKRIAALKYELSKTDYLALKFAEGEITAEDYADTLEQRRAWRSEINDLEAKKREIIKNTL